MPNSLNVTSLISRKRKPHTRVCQCKTWYYRDDTQNPARTCSLIIIIAINLDSSIFVYYTTCMSIYVVFTQFYEHHRKLNKSSYALVHCTLTNVIFSAKCFANLSTELQTTIILRQKSFKNLLFIMKCKKLSNLHITGVTLGFDFSRVLSRLAETF